MREKRAKNKIALFLAALTTALTLSGCQYSSFDEYLEILGMKEPAYEDDYASREETLVVSEDSTSSSFDLAPSYQPADNECSADEIEATGEISFASDGETSGTTTATYGGGYDADKSYSSSYKELTEAELNEQMKAARQNAGLTPDNVKKLKSQQQGLYAFDRLTGSGQTLYVEIPSIIQTMSENVPVSTQVMRP